MTICFVAYKFGTEQELGEHLGTYHYFIETLRRMSRLGHEIYVIAPWLTFAKKGSENVDGIKVLRYYPPLFNKPKLLGINRVFRAWYIAKTGKKVLALDKQLSLDALCVWQARETGYAVAKIADRLRAPFIFRQITAWAWHFERMRFDRAAQKKFARAIYAKARQVIFVSRAAASAEKDLGLPQEKIRIMGVAIETDIFKPAPAATAGSTILFISRINFVEKGIGYLLDAMPRILQEVPDAKLVIVGGGGEEQRMREQIKSLNIEAAVEITGKRPFVELPNYLNGARVLVVPSVWVEHFGQVTIEAMACGIPVVTSDIGGSTEINVDGETGFIVPKADSAALASAIIRILKDRELQKRLGENARRRVEENYSYQVLVKKFLDLLAEVKHG